MGGAIIFEYKKACYNQLTQPLARNAMTPPGDSNPIFFMGRLAGNLRFDAIFVPDNNINEDVLVPSEGYERQQNTLR